MSRVPRPSELRIHKLVDSNIIGLFSWDLQGRITGTNDAFCKIVGYASAELLSGKITWRDLTPPESHTLDADAIDELRRTGSAMPYEKEFIHKSGERIPVLIGGTLFTGSDQTGICFVLDLSDRSRMEQALRESEERYRIVAETARDAIVTLDENGTITYANPAVEKIFGYLPAQVVGRHLAMLMPQQLLPGCPPVATPPDQGENTRHPWQDGEVSAVHKNGHKLVLDLTVGEFQREGRHSYTGIMRDITSRKKAEILCTTQNQVLEMIATGGPLPEILEDLVFMIESQCEGMYGSILLLDEDGIHMTHIAAPRLPSAYTAALDGTSIGPKAGSCGTAMYFNKPVIVTDITQDPLWADYRELARPFGLRACWSLPITSCQGKVLGAFAMYYTDVRSPEREHMRLAALACHIAGIAIERQRSEDYINHLAHHDALTGLPNRVLLQTSLSQAIAQARRHKSTVAVLFIDLDNFKTINDSLGHHIGDLLLKAVAERLQGCLREQDQVARLGGDEFMIILPAPQHESDAALVAAKVLASLEHAFFAEGHELHAAGSIGISLYPGDGETVEALMQAADTAMYHAKEKGRGNYQFFTQHLNLAIQHRLITERQLRHALVRGELALYYQPQVDMKNQRTFGAEALIRWHHPERGLVSPSEFITIAEDTGLILPIGEWALREACKQLKRWRAAGLPNLKIAVNMSTRQIFQCGLIDIVVQALDETALPANALHLEITESILMKPSDENLGILMQLDQMGVQLSVDDFGTGYSSLSYLRRFPIHTLKIDQSFVRGIGQDQNDMTITDAIIAMAKSLHLNVIAEGVETAEQAAFLMSRDCPCAQGFYYGKPVAAGVFTPPL